MYLHVTSHVNRRLVLEHKEMAQFYGYCVISI